MSRSFGQNPSHGRDGFEGRRDDRSFENRQGRPYLVIKHHDRSQNYTALGSTRHKQEEPLKPEAHRKKKSVWSSSDESEAEEAVDQRMEHQRAPKPAVEARGGRTSEDNKKDQKPSEAWERYRQFQKNATARQQDSGGNSRFAREKKSVWSSSDEEEEATVKTRFVRRGPLNAQDGRPSVRMTTSSSDLLHRAMVRSFKMSGSGSPD
ncbi:hypothetical protein L596_018064 [Steinernema carpocapsae]|uniref:Uncharacterized protein n=1 Tax=Steinernema carpocapsae TaxID=34508 RepID=A0A4U5N4A2_STECR|nr:hypothetical protein L596_018064 [Steinernema carpocapsae]